MAMSAARAPAVSAHTDHAHRPLRSPRPASRAAASAPSAPVNGAAHQPRSTLPVERSGARTPSAAAPPPALRSTSPTAAASHPPARPAVPKREPSDPPKLKRGDFSISQIPPFRGSSAGPSASTSAPAPPAAPSAIPPALTKTELTSRRVSYPSVFSLPRQDPRPATGGSSSSSTSAASSSAATLGLGIAGVGVGAAGAKEALVIERVGEAPARGDDAANGRRGSLKRVLISDGEDELASVRVAAPADNRDRMEVADPSLPLPLQPAPAPPPLVHRDSAPSLVTQCRNGSSSPVQTRDSPPSANKRRRTSRPTPLDSLATTATDLLSAAPQPSSFAAPRGGIPVSTLVLGQPATEQQQREVHRRRASASLASSAPASNSAVAAPDFRRPSTAATQQDTGSLAKRRGHRPTPVATGPSPAAHRSSFSAAQGESFASLRSAPVEIPSVLVGSPMEAAFAARARERERASAELPPIRRAMPSVPSARETAPPPRRQSQSAGGAAQPQPPLVSSSSYYIRPNQPLGPGVNFPPPHHTSASSNTATSPRSGGPVKERERGAEREWAGAPQPMRLPSITRATGGAGRVHPQQQQAQGPPSGGMQQGFHPHLLQAYPPPSGAYGPPPGGPLSPLAPLSASIAAPGAPPGPIGSPSFSALPPHSAGLAPPPSYDSRPGSGHGPPPTSSSKQAFLANFSTFYDSLADSRVLTASLDAQLARAAQLLATLQHAEASFDAALTDVRRESDRRWRAVEERLARLEGVSASASTSASGGSSGPSALEERLARLERLLLERETSADSGARRASGDSASSGAVADSEASAGAMEGVALGGARETVEMEE